MRRMLLIAAVVAGTLAAVVGTPASPPAGPAASSPPPPGTQAGRLQASRRDASVPDLAHLATMIETEQDHITAVELAHWIRDRKPGLRVMDLRTPSEYAKSRVPSSVNITLPDLATREFTRSDTIVLVSERGGHAAQAWVLLQTRGYPNVFFLRGGMEEWFDDVLRSPEQKELSRYFGGVRSGDGC